MSATTLSSLKKGQKAIVTGYSFNKIICKVCDLGLLPGTLVEVSSIIPFNGPLCVCLDKNRCKLIISKKEASCVLVNLV